MTPGQRERYSRQIVFAAIGEEGQARLLGARAAIVGCGALGSFQAEALCRAGVGHLTLIDRDYVESSNLQRQWLYAEPDAEEGLPKAVAAKRRLAVVNSEVEVTAHVEDLTPSNIEDLLADASVILDGTDNFETRYLLNDFAVCRAISWVYGAAVGSYGLAMPVLPGESACLRCVFPEPPPGAQPTCETEGVLNAVTGVVAAWQVGWALRVLTQGVGRLRPTISMFDVWQGSVRQIEQPPRDRACPCCGLRQFVFLEGRERSPISLCGRNAVQIHARRGLDLKELHQRLRPLGQVRSNEFALRFFVPPYEMTVFPDGRAIIKGTTDIGLARSLYSRYIGQ